MKKVLVANRGEIALRIMRSLKEMGIITVAVYSEADRNALFTRYADEAYFIGPSPSNQSYLIQEKIIEVAKNAGVEGIHPGYGFLSENASFSALVQANGMTFIGPNPEAIEMMGNKLAAKQAALIQEVPLVPGTAEPISDTKEASEIAKKIGFPVLIKAAAGGGGKGMRVVENEEEFEEQLNRAQSEALNAFGDGSVFLEKYVASPRHIEIQVLSDTHGNHLYLFERDCSVQRRHQKVIEEAPSGVLTEKIRHKMGENAVKIAKACNYVGAGTVEFIMDEKLNFYFLEMNTRLQVEHPVTEMITGLDLVKEQVKIARGEAISFKQEDLKINGHAIELRVYAEDPTNNFLPDIGTLSVYRTPDGPGIRVDSGYEEGQTIPVFYDPMIAKMCVHAPTRKDAIAKMIRAIDDFRIVGVANTLAFGKFVMEHEAFSSAQFDTHFVAKHFSPEKLIENKNPSQEEMDIAALVSVTFIKKDSPAKKVGIVNNQPTQTTSNWKLRSRMR